MADLERSLNHSPLGRMIRHPVDSADMAMKLSSVASVFGDLCDIKMAQIGVALAPFCVTRPLTYFDRNAFRAYLAFLEEDVNASLNALELHGAQTSQAINAVFRETDSWRAELRQDLSKPNDFLRFDRLWHPEYQRYSEHAFNHLTRIPLELLQQARGKNYQALQLAQRADKLVDLGLAPLAGGFNARMRNAISHGGVHYGDYEIRYVAANGEEVLSASEFLQQFDELVDTCSAHVAALVAFVCRHFDLISDRSVARLPAGVRFLLLRGLCQHPGFDVEGLLTVGDDSTGHVNVYCLSRTRSHQVHLYEALHAAVQLYRLGGSSPVISITINCGKSIPSSLIVSGQALREALIEGAPEETIAKVIQANLLWHDTNAFGRWFYIIWTQFGSSWAQARVAMRKQWRQSGLGVWRDRYVIRHVQNLSVGHLRRLVAEIVVKETSDLNREALRGIIRHATRILCREGICGKDMGKLLFLRLRPSYVVLRVHSEDARVRELQGRSNSVNTLCAISEWISIWRRHKPIWLKQPHETVGGLRIRWIQSERERDIASVTTLGS